MRVVFAFLTDTVWPAICLVGIGYNVLVMLNSEDGVRMNSILVEEIAAERETLAELQAEQAYLSDRADRLMTASLDHDLLEERVRSVLGLVRPSEFMIKMDELDAVAAVSPTLTAEEAEAMHLASLVGEAAVR